MSSASYSHILAAHRYTKLLLIDFFYLPVIAVRSAISLLFQRDALPIVAPPHLHAILLHSHRWRKVKERVHNFMDMVSRQSVNKARERLPQKSPKELAKKVKKSICWCVSLKPYWLNLCLWHCISPEQCHHLRHTMWSRWNRRYVVMCSSTTNKIKCLFLCMFFSKHNSQKGISNLLQSSP